MQLFLASMSPRRHELLKQLGIAFKGLAIDINEQVNPHEGAAQYVERMAQEKAEAGFALVDQLPDALVLTADTIVVLDGNVLGKPANQAQAQAMLRSLSGRTHQVITAFALKTAERMHIQRVQTEVRFRKVLEMEVQWYWNTGEQADKAGGYAIQGLGGSFVQSISGSYSSVVGLPLAELVLALRDFGIDFAHS